MTEKTSRPGDYTETAGLKTRHDEKTFNSKRFPASTFAIPGDPGEADAMQGELGPTRAHEPYRLDSCLEPLTLGQSA